LDYDTDQFSALLLLADHSCEYSEEVKHEISSMAETIKLLEDTPGTLFESPDELCSLISKVKSNSFAIWSRNGYEPVWCGISLYLRSSFFNHSCFPNCTVIQDNNTKGFAHLYPGGASFTIRTLCFVPKGTELCISYIPLDDNTAKRQKMLQANWLFLCNCVRCSDPTSDDRPITVYCCRASKCSGGLLIPNADATADQEDDPEEVDYSRMTVGVCRVCFASYYMPAERDIFNASTL